MKQLLAQIISTTIKTVFALVVATVAVGVVYMAIKDYPKSLIFFGVLAVVFAVAVAIIELFFWAERNK